MAPNYDNEFKALHADGSYQDGLVFDSRKIIASEENVRISAALVLESEQISSFEIPTNKGLLFWRTDAFEKGEPENIEVTKLVRQFAPDMAAICGSVALFRVHKAYK